MSAEARLRALVERLRAECPWDQVQTAVSMQPYLLEETYEVLEAIGGPDTTLRDELGDLLFQVYFHARLAEERGAFDIAAVADAVVAKMIERHPHVYAGADSGASVAEWEAQKARTRTGSRVDGVPAALPALLRAHRVGEKVAHVGFDWPDLAGVLAKVDEERAELAEALAQGDAASIRHEYGDLLLATANLGRYLGMCSEDVLREANARFERRFRHVEARAREAGVAMEAAGLERLEQWWQSAKRAESGSTASLSV